MKAAYLLQMLTLRGHTFMPGPLSHRSTVVDLGAHKGEFASQMRGLFGCRVIAVEANPDLANQIRRSPGIEVMECAVTGRDGDATFHIAQNPEASSINGEGEPVTVKTVTLRTLLNSAQVDHVDLLKVDIEGAEVDMFDSLTDEDLRRCDQFSVEWHDFCGLVNENDIDRVVARLRHVGFDDIRFRAPTPREDNMNWLFVRRGLSGAGPLRRAYLKHVVQPARALIHRLRGGGFLKTAER